MAQQIQLRSDTTGGWEDNNPILAQGELGYDITTKTFKIGDGESTWSELDYFSGNGLTLPTSIKDTNGADLIVFEKGYTGVARIDAVQDDLALRSARDILLYAGDDGPGKVYIGWGDANYTPDATNEVATIGYVDEATGANAVKYRVWGYPSDNAIAIMPTTDGESIALKSSDAAAIRWHVRNNGASGQSIIPTSAEVTAGEGNYLVVFTIPEQDSVPPVGPYYYQINCPDNDLYNAALYAQAATTTTLTFYYDIDPGEFSSAGASIYPPSVYAQFEVNEDGAYIKIADWTSGQGSYSQTWQFTKEGAIHFPYGYSNQRTGNGDVLRFASSTDQAIITGPIATESAPNAGRLVVAGQDGSTNGDYDGEGGDIYLWAGRGGGTNGDGGDIKIDGGNGLGTAQGGYVKIRGGNADTGNGGFVQIESGYSNSSGQGGNISINAQAGGAVTITGNGNIDLYSTNGVYVNEDLVATQTYVTAAKSTFPMVLATDNGSLTGEINHVGKLLYANLVQDTAYFAIPTNATVAIPVGSEIKFATSGESIWQISAVDGETTTLVGEGSNGYTAVNYNFIIPPNATATLLKVETDRWILSGLRLTD